MGKRYENPIILYNPNAGGGRGKKKFDRYLKILENAKLFPKIESRGTLNRNDAIQAVNEIVKSGRYDLIISIGGDGTISTIANALMAFDNDKRLPIFPIPSGSGDSLLRDFGITTIEDAIDHFRKMDEPKKFDLIQAEDIKTGKIFYCINILGMGFISDVVMDAEKQGKIWGGGLSYIVSIFTALGRFRPYETVIRYNNGKDEVKIDKAYFLTVSNTKFTGGKIMIAPDADYQDGFSDLIVLHDIGRFKFLKGFLKAFSGRHLQEKGCLYLKSDTFEIHSTPDFTLMPDGELEGKGPLRLKTLRNQVRLTV